LYVKKDVCRAAIVERHLPLARFLGHCINSYARIRFINRFVTSGIDVFSLATHEKPPLKKRLRVGDRVQHDFDNDHCDQNRREKQHFRMFEKRFEFVHAGNPALRDKSGKFAIAMRMTRFATIATTISKTNSFEKNAFILPLSR
jgi:hypothetical protein